MIFETVQFFKCICIFEERNKNAILFLKILFFLKYIKHIPSIVLVNFCQFFNSIHIFHLFSHDIYGVNKYCYCHSFSLQAFTKNKNKKNSQTIIAFHLCLVITSIPNSDSFRFIHFISHS